MARLIRCDFCNEELPESVSDRFTIDITARQNYDFGLKVDHSIDACEKCGNNFAQAINNARSLKKGFNYRGEV